MDKALRILGVALCLAVPAFGGTLRMGDATVDGTKVTVPVVLDSEYAEGVAAMDFRLKYDPAVLTPVSVEAGAAATTANKQVQANMREPGEYIVVLLGMNQNQLEPGEVARVVMEKVSTPTTGKADLSITSTTFASAAGVEIPSEGSTLSVKIGEATTDDTTDDTTDTTDDTTDTTDNQTDTSNSDSSDSNPTNHNNSNSGTAETNDGSTGTAVTGGTVIPAGGKTDAATGTTGTAVAGRGTLPEGLAAQGATTPADLAKLAAAKDKLAQARAGIPQGTPAAPGSPAASTAAAPGAPAVSPTGEGNVPTPGSTEATGAPATGATPAPGTAVDATQPQGAQLAKAMPNPAATDAAKSAAGTQPAAPTPAPGASNGMKIALVVIVAALVAVIAIVRRRLFS